MTEKKAMLDSPAQHRGSRIRVQPALPFPHECEAPTTEAFPGMRAIEREEFPFELFSTVAALESWRKEINRPLSHIHKWWAQRLGTVFRAILLGTFLGPNTDLLKAFYSPVRLGGTVVFDPFMGSGTTLIEAMKLGATAIGRDINPVAAFLVRNALRRHNRNEVISTFTSLERDLAHRLRPHYEAVLDDGTRVTVLYFFWVKSLPCPKCAAAVDLFRSYVFAKHAYPASHPRSQIVCPGCGEINEGRYDANRLRCRSCHIVFAPQSGPAIRTEATCPTCGEQFSIACAVRATTLPPAHRMYAKLVLGPNGEKAYVRATEADRRTFSRAQRDLSMRHDAYPAVPIEPGYNTNQAIGYNYRYWHQMFNDRQLLGMSMIAERIKAIPNTAMRELFTCLFSGVLEFNNMFASFKGEGTGAVRHMFSHHVLKPERTPVEANLWGTPRSSGAFATLFESRVLRALDYADDPFEVKVVERSGRAAGSKVFGLSLPIGSEMVRQGPKVAGDRVELSCGDSSSTDLPSGCVDAVITDPPFFDNVHYSELADFFHVWQRFLLEDERATARWSTRSEREVQHGDSDVFTERLAGIWRECCRVLKNDGNLVFTYHHSRSEGWISLLKALMAGGFVVVAAHPIKAEMSVATPKHQAKEPIDIDVVLVCRKRNVPHNANWPRAAWSDVVERASRQLQRLKSVGQILSRNDVQVVVMAQALCYFSALPSVQAAVEALRGRERDIATKIDELHGASPQPNTAVSEVAS